MLNTDEVKDDLQHYLQVAREVLAWTTTFAAR